MALKEEEEKQLVGNEVEAWAPLPGTILSRYTF
jgi:hypothetical protein